MAALSDTLAIVEPAPALASAIAAMTMEAFAGEYGTGEAEASLIAALRADGDVIVELVALEGSALVGHILFSRITDQPFTGRIAALAPMCARVGHQKKGVGSVLVHAGLERCRAKGVTAVVVLGDTAYYGRFGFSAPLAEGIGSAYAGPHLQALELEPGALQGVKYVAHAPAFGAAGG